MSAAVALPDDAEPEFIPDPNRKGYVLVTCCMCQTQFSRLKKEAKRKHKEGQKPYCSTKCVNANPLRSAPANARALDVANVEIRRALVNTFRNAKRNAPEREVAYLLTPEDEAFLIRRASGRCEISGLPFEGTPVQRKHEKRPFIPSLDRIDARGDYTIDNCQLVLNAVNQAMLNWGRAEFMRVVQGIHEMREEKTPESPERQEELQALRDIAAMWQNRCEELAAERQTLELRVEELEARIEELERQVPKRGRGRPPKNPPQE